MDVNQITLDTALAEAAKQEAISRADYATNPLWRDRAFEAVKAVCSNYENFTTDEVWLALSKTDGMSTPERRAMGPIMIEATKRGWCSATSEFRLSRRKECHRNPKRVYRSRLYGIERDL